MSELIRVENLKKYFRTPGGMLHAVDDVSFSIDAGKTLGVRIRLRKVHPGPHRAGPPARHGGEGDV